MPNLVGIGNSQVPTNAMLGGVAYQDSVGEINIDKIKAKISQSVNRLFVYDTRKDSDGGAWRHQTQRTSWYNETLVTAQRGIRREFPSIAVIVSYNNGYVIYDGDDPSLPMWMELWQYVNDSSGSTTWWGGSGTGHAIAAMNGEMAVTAGAGARVVNFIKDKISVWYSPAAGGNYGINHGIADRNTPVGSWYKADQDYRQLVANTPNEISVGVTPYAETHPHTGLPIPTYCITTPTGTTVVESTQAKTYDIVGTSSGYTEQYRSVIKHSRLYLISDPRILYTFNLPLAQDASGSSLTGYSGLAWLTGLQSSGVAASTASLAVTNKGDIAVGTSSELLLVRPNFSQSNSLSTEYTKHVSIGSVWNTGWQSGKSMLATLSTTVESDNIAPSYSGKNLVTNGGLWSSSGWTIDLNGASGGSPGITGFSGTVTFTQGSSNSVWLYLYRNITTVVGQHYEVELRVDSTNTNANWRVSVGGIGNIMGYGTSANNLGKGSHFANFTATATSHSINIQQGGGATVTGTIGYIAVRRVLVKNGRFSSDATGWTASNGATLTSDVGRLKMVGDTTDYPRAMQNVSGLVVGKRYVFVGEGKGGGHSYIITLGAGAGNPNSGWVNASDFKWTHWFVATATTLDITCQGSSNDNLTYYFDNISLKEAMVYDHSSVWRALSVFGDMKTVPVASGAELMAYTNFNGDNNAQAGNYLMQEYVENAYYDFTGDFNISFWFDGNLGGDNTNLEIKWVNDSDDNGWMIHINNTTSYFLDGGWDAYSSFRQINSTSCYRDSWCKVNFVRRSNLLYYYLDGVLVDSGYNMSGWNMTKTTYHKLTIKMGRNSENCKLALFNIGDATTTDAEIWEMYRDELPMFEPNSKVALIGTDTMASSGVINSTIKAVAYDDSTDTLHVGTEHGRTDMNGLNTINTTTTAVTTDISASNGLIAEQ